MHRLIIVGFSVICVSIAFNETEFVDRYCDESKSQIRCTDFTLTMEDWQNITKRLFTISEASVVRLNGNILYLNEFLFEKFPNAKIFEVEGAYAAPYELQKPFDRPPSNWRYESKIENLFLGGNEIPSISKSTSFHVLTNLKNLEISFATSFPLDLDDVLLEKCTELESVFIQKSNISSVTEGAFKNQKNLKTLSLSDNAIESLKPTTFKSQEKLTTLNLDNNNIQFLSQGSFWPQSLIDLSLSSNHIKTVTKNHFKNLRNLKKLNLNDNAISVLSSSAFNENNELQSLNLRNNHIKSVSFSSLDNLVFLDVSGNEIKDWPKKLMNDGRHLKSLSLSGNSVSVQVPSSFFEGLMSLEHLEISRAYFGVSVPRFHKDAFAPLTNLKELRLETDGLETGDITRSHLSSLTKLERLSLRWNPNLLFEDDTFDDLINLEYLEYDNS